MQTDQWVTSFQSFVRRLQGITVVGGNCAWVSSFGCDEPGLAGLPMAQVEWRRWGDECNRDVSPIVVSGARNRLPLQQPKSELSIARRRRLAIVCGLG